MSLRLPGGEILTLPDGSTVELPGEGQQAQAAAPIATAARGMDFLLSIDGAAAAMTFSFASTILNNIWLSLMVPRGGFFQNPEFGSRLHLLQREKSTERTATLARAYAEEALQWLIDTGRATEIEVETERDETVDPHRLKLRVRAVQADGREVSFEKFLEVV